VTETVSSLPQSLQATAGVVHSNWLLHLLSKTVLPEFFSVPEHLGAIVLSAEQHEIFLCPYSN
jgi:hypothetical protein